MAGDSDTMFANLPPRPRPLGTGYGAMPTSRNIEDRRGQPRPMGPFLPGLGGLAVMMRYLQGPTPQQQAFLKAHAGTLAPTGSNPLTMPYDPDLPADPSVKAQIKAWQRWTNPYDPGSSTPPWAQNLPTPQGSMPTPYPNPNQRGPQFTPDQLANALQYWGGGQ